VGTVHAAGIIPDPNDPATRITQNQPKTSLNDTLNSFSIRIEVVVFLLLGGLAVLLIILAGLRYISSAGNPDRVKQARQSIIQIVLGIILLVATYYIANQFVGVARLIVP
jgi:hypothetical protein